MTEYDDYDEYEYGEPEPKADGPKALREALKAAKAEAKANAVELAKLLDRERTRTVRDVLSSKGINSKVADLIPPTVGADEDAVAKWVEQYADVFGSPNAGATEGGAAETSTIPPEDQSAMQRISDAASSGKVPDSRLQETIDALNNASGDDVLKMIEAAQKTGVRN